MDNTEKKELVIIPEKQIEPNQESITKTFNDWLLIIKSCFVIALFILIVTLIISILS